MRKRHVSSLNVVVRMEFKDARAAFGADAVEDVSRTAAYTRVLEQEINNKSARGSCLKSQF